MQDGPELPGKTAATDLAGFGEVARTIIESVREAIGVLYRPRAIRAEGEAAADADAYAIIRRAEAEAQAALIADGSAEDLERRALARLRAREMRKQITLEQTLDAAVAEAEETGSGTARAIAEDWTAAFIDHAQEISEERLRQIWARVLARQADAEAPAVSRATLDAVRLLEPSMAETFERSLRLWVAMGQIMDLDDGPEGAININEMDMLALTEIGLLRRESGREANLEFNSTVLSFHEGPNTIGASGRPPTMAQFWTPREIRIDRLLPTWRGMELAAVLLPGLYQAMTDPDGPGAMAPAYADDTTRAEILTTWAAGFQSRGVEVLLNGLKPRDDIPDGGGSILAPSHLLEPDGSETAWRELSADEVRAANRGKSLRRG